MQADTKRTAKLQRELARLDLHTRTFHRHSGLAEIKAAEDVALWRRFNPRHRSIMEGFTDAEVFAVLGHLQLAQPSS